MIAYYSRIPCCRRTWLRKVYYEMKCLECFGGRRAGTLRYGRLSLSV